MTSNDDFRAKLKKLDSEFKDLTGNNFDTFYCPILYRDEPAELCKAHVINKAFEKTPRTWTIQRKDVDNFYGSFFESEFVGIEYNKKSLSPSKVLTDSKLSKIYKPKILYNGQEVEYFFAPDEVPENFISLEISHANRSMNLGLKKDPKYIKNIESAKWEIEVKKDFRLSSLVSLIKGAHLTLFDMLGYQYALTTSGYFVGHQLLGDFYLNNLSKAKKEIIENAIDKFSDFSAIVRPILSTSSIFKGTILDKRIFYCKTPDGVFWSLIIFIPINDQLHAVLLPAFDDPRAHEIYLSFLINDDTILYGSLAEFDENKNAWNVSKEVVEINWPKLI